MTNDELMNLVNRSLFATIGYTDEMGRQNVRRVFCVWHKGLGRHLIEYFTPIVPGRIAYPSRLYFPVDPPVRWISSAQRLAFARYSRMFTLPVSIQIALCTMRSMIASA